jgi:hypothetical protein
LALSGSAGDNVSVISVSWTNDRGGSGTTIGTTSWRTGSIGLKNGTNVITVTARDAAGNQTSKALTVTYKRRRWVLIRSDRIDDEWTNAAKSRGGVSPFNVRRHNHPIQ